MHQAANGTEFCEERNNGFGVIVSKLISPVEHMQPSINLTGVALARDASPSDQRQADVIVLDDVAPQFIGASCALNACNTSLGTACSSRLDARASGTTRFRHGPLRRHVAARRNPSALQKAAATQRPQCAALGFTAL
jgi:hypothetical protein